MQRAIDSGIVAITAIARNAGGKAEKRGTVATTRRLCPLRLSATSMLLEEFPSNDTVTWAASTKSLRLKGAVNFS